MYTVITENDISNWSDKTGLLYHFPSRYLKALQPGTAVVYYKGKMTDKKFKRDRLSTEPHYFGIATIGKVSREENSSNYFAQIVDFQIFNKAVHFKNNRQPLEKIPASRRTNYWRDGVRVIDTEDYNKILELSDLSPTRVLNDEEFDSSALTTTLVEGGKKLIYTTTYERNKRIRDLAIKEHGYSCKGCNINFKEWYGEWGEGYIHVHHLKPVSQVQMETEINPKTDLTVVCPNCHSMIHRYKNCLLSIEDLRAKIKLNR